MIFGGGGGGGPIAPVVLKRDKGGSGDGSGRELLSELLWRW